MHQLGYFEPSTDMSVSEKEECLPPKQLQQAGFIAYTGQASDGQLTPGDLELLRETKPGAKKGANAKAIYIMRCTTRLYGLTTIAYVFYYAEWYALAGLWECSLSMDRQEKKSRKREDEST